MYQNFLLLSIGIYILSSKALVDDYLNDVLILFVKHFGELDGAKHLSYNLQNHVHLAQDVRNHSVLDTFRAFKFEHLLRQAC